MNMQASPSTVTRELVPEDQRLVVVEQLFGMAFPLQLEPVIYGITERMAADYDGGYWEFWSLSNEGFYMAPSEDRIFHVKCQNMYEGDLSADALGITSCLYAYSNLSFSLTDTGTAYQGGGGLHVYIVIKGVDLEKLRRY